MSNLSNSNKCQKSDSIQLFMKLGNLPVERAKDAVCFLQQCGVSLV